jgi:hypothetical protein
MTRTETNGSAIKRRGWLLVVCCLSVTMTAVAGCQTVGPALTKSIGYNPLYDQGDELRALVAKGDLRSADAAYARNEKFFESSGGAYESLLSELAAKINDQYAPRLKLLAAADVADEGELAWSRERASIASATSALAEYDGFAIVRNQQYRSPDATALKGKLDAARQDYEARAASSFAKYSQLSSRDFFDAYPIKLPESSVFTAALSSVEERLAAASPNEVLSFARIYSRQLNMQVKTAVGHAYLVSWRREQGPSLDPAKLAAALRSMQTAGIASKLSSSSLLAAFSIAGAAPAGSDFALAIDDSPALEVQKISSGEISSKRLDGFADAILVRVTGTKTARKIVDQSQQPSTYIAGYRTERNPDYDAAELDVVTARSDLQNVRVRMAAWNRSQQVQTTALGSISEGLTEAALLVAESKAEGNLRDAIAKLKQTPRTIQTEVYQDYAYVTTQVLATRMRTSTFTSSAKGAGRRRNSRVPSRMRGNSTSSTSLIPRIGRELGSCLRRKPKTRS